MNHRTTEDPACAVESLDPLEMVLRYHQETKHHFFAMRARSATWIGRISRIRFDGVFANAALFHVPSLELPRVLPELHATLKPRGVLFSANPHGHNQEGWNRGRYGAYHDLETWPRFMSAAGFVELTHYYRPAGLPREQQPWLAGVWRRWPIAER